MLAADARACTGVLGIQVFIAWVQRRQARHLTPLLSLRVIASPREHAAAIAMMTAPVARAADPHRTERPNGTLVAGGADGTMMCPAIPVNTGLLRHRTARARATLI